MIARRICIALVLVAFAIALVPANAAALPSPEEFSEFQRPWSTLFTRLHQILSEVANSVNQFIATEGASISTGG